MRIDGLTDEQCKMLDIMWQKDTEEELVTWFKSLPMQKLEMALVLHQMLVQELCEEDIDVNYREAKKMLQQIGVNCG